MPEKKTERQAIDDVIKRLTKKYPDVSEKHIEKLVEENYDSFKNARLRDYIAVLVEHGAKSEIQQEKRKKK